MNKVTLAFAPGASPTYVPLGVASLAAFLSRQLPHLEVATVDLSIHFWRHLLERDKSGRDLLHGFCHQPHTFFNRDAYRRLWDAFLPFQGTWQTMSLALDTLFRRGEQPADDAYESTLFTLLQFQPGDTLVLSAAYPDQLIHAAYISSLVKKRFPDVTILLGGSALPAIHGEGFLRAVPTIDRIYLGEGEEGLCQFFQGDATSDRGWQYLQNGILTTGKRPRAIPIFELPTPDFSGLDVALRFSPSPVLPVAFSRGCRWRKCAFCSHNFGFAGYRVDEFGQFVDRLATLQSTYGVSHFYFTDQYIDAHSLEGIAQEILRRQLQIRFHVMGRPTADYTAPRLQLLFEAGCRWISWGVESGAQSLLDGCNKGTRVPDIAKVLENSHTAGINNLAMMVFGLPGTSAARFQETLDFATDVSPFVDAFTDSSFQLFENTPYFKNAGMLQLEPQQNEVLFAAGDADVLSTRRQYATLDEDGRLALPAGPDEVGLWKRWKSWVRGEAFFESLPAEHYLLHADQCSKRPHPDLPKVNEAGSETK